MNDLPDLGIHQWIHDEAIVNEKGETLTFQDHLFLFEPYDDWAPRQVYKKCSQVGVSVMMNTKVPYAMKSRHWNVIYTLPSDADVEEFVPTKTDKMIQANPTLRDALATDNVYLKQFYDRFWHFKGTRSKTGHIMTTADLLVHDEKDRSDQSIIDGYRSRIKKSSYRGIWELSNPSVKNFGVDVTWKRSDRKEWVIKCAGCDQEQVMDWGRNLDYTRKMFVCSSCGHELDDVSRRLGNWVPANPDSEISGYHISQLMAPWISAKELIIEEEETDEEYFNNFILGEPIGDGDAEDFRQIIIDAWTPNSLRKPPYFMGVDIGSTKHYVVGNREGIFEIGKVKTREELELIIEHYNPMMVMDSGPERTWAEEFRKKYPKMHLCFYNLNDKKGKEMIAWGKDKDTGYVRADRHRVIDATVSAMVYADIQFDLPPKDLELYMRHWLTMVKKKEVTPQGLVKYKWDANSDHAPDHWVHATVYYFIARKRGNDAKHVAAPTPAGKEKLVIPSADGFEQRDLKDLMDNKW